jgi:hypothetical protein
VLLYHHWQETTIEPMSLNGFVGTATLNFAVLMDECSAPTNGDHGYLVLSVAYLEVLINALQETVL